MYYGLDGQVITRDEWVGLWEQKGVVCSRSADGASTPEDDPTRIGWDESGEVTVSTVWIGIDHGFGSGHHPLIFETMIFGGVHDQDTWRYSTREEAEAGHAAAVALALPTGR